MRFHEKISVNKYFDRSILAQLCEEAVYKISSIFRYILEVLQSTNQKNIQYICMIIHSPPYLAIWLKEAQVGASSGRDGRGIARFSGIQQLLHIVAINPVG